VGSACRAVGNVFLSTMLLNGFGFRFVFQVIQDMFLSCLCPSLLRIEMSVLNRLARYVRECLIFMILFIIIIG
jgi:hypothetical protein